ncbi:MAG TPA: hypothetical protein VEA80_02190 [Vitreimonas sp.]|uniref:hypothetical protein n=1 Tax=Vitreimonas sp. TaxID=3069702 RepID=UPI002D29B290|nr:hypothetical protein [Vitreimonas sp.]HYD86261.1 hypothetical protein [Vitreimonas sp.]
MAKMFDVEDRSWIAKSVVTPNADAEITFSLPPTYHPDPNSLDEAGAIALPAPATTSAERYDLASKDVLPNEQGLVDHYKAVLQLARQYGHSYNEFSHHMWLRLHFSWDGGAIGFAWYDTLDSMELVFDWLRDAADGEMWSDVEQGWEMIAVRVGERFHFRQGGFDQGGEYANVALPREELLASISTLRERMGRIIAKLAADLGEDYWNRHRYDLRTDLT